MTQAQIDRLHAVDAALAGLTKLVREFDIHRMQSHAEEINSILAVLEDDKRRIVTDMHNDIPKGDNKNG